MSQYVTIVKHFADNAYYSRRAPSPFFISNPLIESITENEIVFQHRPNEIRRGETKWKQFKALWNVTSYH